MPLLFPLIFTIAQFLIWLGHWFVYKTLSRFLGITNLTVLLALKWGLGLLSVAFVLSSILAARQFNGFTRLFYTLAAGWLGAFYFLFLAAVLAWAFSLFPINHKLATEVLFSLAIILSVYSVINASTVRVTRITVKLPGLNEHWKGKTAVWVSDTHLGQIRNINFAKRLSDQISRLNPEAVFIGGDLYDGVDANLNGLAAPFGKIKAPQGVYFITGNHEEFGDNTKYLNAIKQAGIKILSNETIDVNGLQLIGVDYHDSQNKDVYQKVLAKIPIDQHQPSVLLKHEPNNLGVAEKAGIDFQLSGHTHQAQAFPFMYITSKMYKGFDHGFKSFGDLQIYTSTGAGTWGPPIRFLTRSEIVQITFE